MLYVENGAEEIMKQALQIYFDKFGIDFPIYEHLDITRSNGYDVSVKGAKLLLVFIKGRIASNNAVNVPEDYAERLY